MIEVFFDTISEEFNSELSISKTGSFCNVEAELIEESFLIDESEKISSGAVNFKIGFIEYLSS